MAVIQIEPVATTTEGGFSATINGIDLTDTDFLIGTVETPALGNIKARWNDSGICRDKDNLCNISIQDDIKDIILTANILLNKN